MRRALFPKVLYRLTAYFRNAEDKLEAAPSTWVVDGEIEGSIIVRVPVSTTMREAHEIENKLVAQLHKPVIVLTSNIELCKVTKLMPDEINTILNGQAEVDEDEPIAPAAEGDPVPDEQVPE